MSLNTAKNLPYDSNAQDSSIRRVSCVEGETLSNVINLLEWGNYKRIKVGGFSVSAKIEPFKKDSLIRDPLFQFKKGRTYISPKHGRTLAVVIAS